MRVNEENFTTGDIEDVEPTYVDKVIGNHNQDDGAHPDIRKQISETQAFYQSAKDSVQGVAAAAQSAERNAAAAAESSEEYAVMTEQAAGVAAEAMNEAVLQAKKAEEATGSAESLLAETKEIADGVSLAVEKYPCIGENGNWFVWDSELGEFVDSGVYATGPKGDVGPQGIQGEQGVQGENGADGHTPERGVDYWTDEDKAEIVSDVLAALPAAEEVAY